MGSGDRPVFLLPNHRLDKSMLNLVSTLAQATVNRTMGGLFAGSGGLLSELKPTIAYPNPAYPADPVVSFAPFRLAYSKLVAGTTSEFDGGVVDYDPVRPAQATTSWPLDSWVGAPVVFWGARGSANTSIDNQAFWQAGTKYQPIQTQETEYLHVELRAPGVVPDLEFGWVPFAYIQATDWTDTTPVVHPIYFPDSQFFSSGGAAPEYKNWWSGYNPGAGAKTFAIGDQLRWHRNVMSRVIDSTWVFDADGQVQPGNQGTYGWQDVPPRGLVQLNDVLSGHMVILEELASAVVGLQSAVNTLTNKVNYSFRTPILYSYRNVYNTATAAHEIYDNRLILSSSPPTQTTDNAGTFTFSWPLGSFIRPEHVAVVASVEQADAVLGLKGVRYEWETTITHYVLTVRTVTGGNAPVGEIGFNMTISATTPLSDSDLGL